jgi:hypothetical protein
MIIHSIFLLGVQKMQHSWKNNTYIGNIYRELIVLLKFKSMDDHTTIDKNGCLLLIKFT